MISMFYTKVTNSMNNRVEYNSRVSTIHAYIFNTCISMVTFFSTHVCVVTNNCMGYAWIQPCINGLNKHLCGLHPTTLSYFHLFITNHFNAVHVHVHVDHIN